MLLHLVVSFNTVRQDVTRAVNNAILPQVWLVPKIDLWLHLVVRGVSLHQLVKPLSCFDQAAPVALLSMSYGLRAFLDETSLVAVVILTEV